MHKITVKARDTASAMKEVARQLGEDAMIISTRNKNGIVEIEATAEFLVEPEMIQPKVPQIEVHSDEVMEFQPSRLDPSDIASLISIPDEPSRTESDVSPMFTRHEDGLRAEPPLLSEKKVHANFAEFLEEQERLQGTSPESEAIAEVEKPLTNDPLAGWSSLSSEFCDELRSDLASMERSGQALGFLGQVKRQVLSRDARMIEIAHRIVIVGAPGSGKSLVAAKIAAHMMTHDDNRRPELILANARGRSAGALLSDKAQLMNIKMRYRSLDELMRPRPDLDQPEIIEINGSSADARATVEALAAEEGAQVVLALPAGLHPRAASKVCHEWRELSPVVVMTRLDDWQPAAEDIAVLLANGMRLAWTTQGESVLDALDHPSLATLGRWARSWLLDEEI